MSNTDPNREEMSPFWNFSSMCRFIHDGDPPFAGPSTELGEYIVASHPTSRDYITYPFAYVDRQQQQQSSGSSDGGLEFSQTSSVTSDRHVTPGSPPGLAEHPRMIAPFHVEDHSQIGGSYTIHQQPCISLHQVQHHADEVDEHAGIDTVGSFNAAGSWQYPYHGFHHGHSAPTEGYHPIMPHEEAILEDHLPHEVQNMDLSEEATPTVHRYQTIESMRPNYRHRRTPSTGSTTISQRRASTARVAKAKRPAMPGRSASHRVESSRQAQAATTARLYPCPMVVYGCEGAFANKNEWKRHVTTQHMRPGFWRCRACAKPNDFNRKDLFVQHVRRMHPLEPHSEGKPKNRVAKALPQEEAYLQEQAARSYIHLRDLPEISKCVMCPQEFGVWDERMEHIGRHIENAKKHGGTGLDPRDWSVDELTEQWMCEHGILQLSKGALVLAGHRLSRQD